MIRNHLNMRKNKLYKKAKILYCFLIFFTNQCGTVASKSWMLLIFYPTNWVIFTKLKKRMLVNLIDATVLINYFISLLQNSVSKSSNTAICGAWQQSLL